MCQALLDAGYNMRCAGLYTLAVGAFDANKSKQNLTDQRKVLEKSNIAAKLPRLRISATRRESLMILTIEQKKIEPDIAVLEMNGRITMGSDSQKIEWGLAQLLKENQKKVIFDLTEVRFLDSSGVGIIMMCHAKLRKAGGALRLAGAHGMVEEVLALTSVNKIIPLYPCAAEAAADFQLG